MCASACMLATAKTQAFPGPAHKGGPGGPWPIQLYSCLGLQALLTTRCVYQAARPTRRVTCGSSA